MNKLVSSSIYFFVTIFFIVAVWFVYTKVSIPYFSTLPKNSTIRDELVILTSMLSCNSDIRNYQAKLAEKLEQEIPIEIYTDYDFATCNEISKLYFKLENVELKARYTIFIRRVGQYKSGVEKLAFLNQSDKEKGAQFADLRKTVLLLDKTKKDIDSYNKKQESDNDMLMKTLMSSLLMSSIGLLALIAWLISYAVQDSKRLEKLSFVELPQVNQGNTTTTLASILKNTVEVMKNHFWKIIAVGFLINISNLYLILAFKTDGDFLMNPFGNPLSLIFTTIYGICSPIMVIILSQIVTSGDFSLRKTLIYTFRIYSASYIATLKKAFTLVWFIFFSIPIFLKKCFAYQYVLHFIALNPKNTSDPFIMSEKFVAKNYKLVLKITFTKIFGSLFFTLPLAFITTQFLATEHYIISYFIVIVFNIFVYVFDALSFISLTANNGHEIEEFELEKTSTSTWGHIGNFIITCFIWLTCYGMLNSGGSYGGFIAITYVGIIFYALFKLIAGIIYQISAYFRKRKKLDSNSSQQKARSSFILFAVAIGLVVAHLGGSLFLQNFFGEDKACLTVGCYEGRFNFKKEEPWNDTSYMKLRELEANFKITKQIIDTYPQEELIHILQSKANSRADFTMTTIAKQTEKLSSNEKLIFLLSRVSLEFYYEEESPDGFAVKNETELPLFLNALRQVDRSDLADALAAYEKSVSMGDNSKIETTRTNFFTLLKNKPIEDSIFAYIKQNSLDFVSE